MVRLIDRGDSFLMTNAGLSEDVLSVLDASFASHPHIELVKLYGSRAKGTFTDRSDIDLAAFGSALTRSDIADVLLDLDDSNIPYLVDLQQFGELKNQRLIDHINRVGVVIYQREKQTR
jgi:predicted nucleotidyltransferase